MSRHGVSRDISAPDPEMPNLIYSYHKECRDPAVQPATMHGFLMQ
jgi:hypothetical protein